MKERKTAESTARILLLSVMCVLHLSLHCNFSSFFQSYKQKVNQSEILIFINFEVRTNELHLKYLHNVWKLSCLER